MKTSLVLTLTCKFFQQNCLFQACTFFIIKIRPSLLNGIKIAVTCENTSFPPRKTAKLSSVTFDAKLHVQNRRYDYHDTASQNYAPWFRFLQVIEDYIADTFFETQCVRHRERRNRRVEIAA